MSGRPCDTDDIPCHRLDPAARRAFRDLGTRLAARFDDACRQPDVGAGDLPDGLGEHLARFREAPPPCGVTLVRGIDVGGLPDTPPGRTASPLSGHPTTGNLLAVAERLGSLIGYADEKGGDLVHDVHPVRGEEARIENSGASRFGFHTENVHHPLRPDVLGLLCLRQDHDGTGAARVSSVREAAPGLSARTRDVLRRPRFRSLYPTSFTAGADRAVSEPHAVLGGDPDRLVVRFNVHNTHGLDDEAAAAAAELSGALDRSRRRILLEPGDLLLIDNRVALHGRAAFTPRYDGRDRWLRRFYALRSVPERAGRYRGHPRVLPPTAEVAAAFAGGPLPAGSPI